LYHISDFPVNTLYIETVQALSDSTSYAIRWMNAISVWASEEQLAEIVKLEFVKEIIPISSTHHTAEYHKLPKKLIQCCLSSRFKVWKAMYLKQRALMAVV
jgi:hypothetical protein